MSARAIARDMAPPALLNLFRRLSGRSLRFAGHPADWAGAARMSSGYSEQGILDRVIEATRAVTSGKAAYERDATLFDTPSYPFPIIAALLRAAVQGANRIEVIDFGGSLGSTYRQCRPFLDGLISLRWSVIEQPSFVDAGRMEFTTEELAFFGSLAELPPRANVGLVLLSSVLQYLQDPFLRLDDLSGVSSQHLVIDRTPLSQSVSDRLCIQHVPRSIYEASYPCWIFSRSRLMEHLSRRWRLVSEYSCPEGMARTDDGLPFEFKGMILESLR